MKTMTQTQTKKPVDWDELYPGRFIKTGDLKGKKVTLSIEEIEMEELEGNTGKKWTGIVSFRETEKKLTLNKTNGICLRAMFGRTLSEWEGKRVTIFPSKWAGEDCIRIWGSPDIDKDMTVQVALPRRKPFEMVLHKVVPGSKAPAAPPPPEPDETADAREPGDE